MRGSQGPAKRALEPGEQSTRPSGRRSHPASETSRPHPRPRSRSPRSSPLLRAARPRPSRARPAPTPPCGRSHLGGGRPDSFPAWVEAKDPGSTLPSYSGSTTTPRRPGCPESRPPPAARGARNWSHRLSRQCGRISRARASLAGPGARVTTQPT